MNRQMRALTLQDDDERVLEDHALALRRFIREAYGQEDRVKVAADHRKQARAAAIGVLRVSAEYRED
jgi:hypothetical protein